MKTDKTNVLFITRAYGNNAGGMERLSWEMIHHALASPTIDGTVIAHKSAGSRIKPILFVLLAIPKVIIAANKADVVHIGDPVLSLHGWLIHTILKKPVVVTVHGFDILFRNPIYKLYLHLFFRNFSAYIAISGHVQGLLAKQGITANVHIIPPGVSDRLYNPNRSRAELSAYLKTDTSKHIVLCTIGRLTKRKGHEWFITNVLPHLPEHTIYVIAGTGKEGTGIRNAANKHNVQQRVYLLGRVSDDTIELLNNTVDACIQPNISLQGDAEGFGIVLAEAALCERPVYASNIEGIRQAITDGKNGTLLPPEDADAWINALSAHTQHQRPTRKARTYTREHTSWDTITPKYIHLFTVLASRQQE